MIGQKHKILFILHLPPPVHGAAMVGQYIKDSEIINSEFCCHYVNLSMAASIEDVGHFRLKKIVDLVHLLKNIRKKVKEIKPSLVYMTPNAKGGAFFKEFLIIMMLKRMGCKVVIHYHNKGVKTVQDKWMNHQLYKRFFKKLKVILLAECLYDDIKKYVKKEDVFICPNGIKDIASENISKRDSEYPKLLFLSNLLKAKGVFDMTEACKILRKKHISFSCTFIGAESAEISTNVFQSHIKTEGLQDCLEYVGPKFGNDKESYFKLADIFILPSHDECFPLVLLEAMQYGLPCISTNEGAIPDIVDNGKTGFVINKKSPAELADKLEILINDAKLRQEMGTAGREKYKNHYTLELFEHKMAEILNKIIFINSNS